MTERKIGRSIPFKYVNENQKLELSGIAAMYIHEYPRAEELFKKQYDLLYKAQSEEGRSIHKGAPLQNWGVVLIEVNNISEGLIKIAAAFIEDLITSSLQEVIEGSASKALSAFDVSEADKRDIEGMVKSKIESDKDIFDPELIAKEIVRIEDDKILILNISKPQPEIRLLEKIGKKLSGTFQQRVFVGGSYRNIVLLRKMSDIVRDLGYEPQLVGDVLKDEIAQKKLDEEDMHGICMEITDECNYAIFEVSFSNGHMMEIEHCHSMKNEGKSMEVLLLWQILYPEPKIRPPISQMLLAKKFQKKEYDNLTNLAGVIKEFLP